MGGWAIAVHGGAGVDPNLPAERQEEAKRVLSRCLLLGIAALRGGSAAVDVVEKVVRELETDPVFNSGRGSALTRQGTVEMEASIMDGHGHRCGAVSGLSTVRNSPPVAKNINVVAFYCPGVPLCWDTRCRIHLILQSSGEGEAYLSPPGQRSKALRYFRVQKH